MAALTQAGALDLVDSMTRNMSENGVDVCRLDILRDPHNMSRSWRHTVDAARIVGAFPPRGRASENRFWRIYITEAVHAVRRGDETKRRHFVTLANKVRAQG